MRARATYAKHGTVQRDEQTEIPTISLDYFFYGQSEGENANLQVKDGAIDFVANIVIAAINETGYRRITLKSDGEPAILALKQDVKPKAKDIEIILKEALTGDHSANGSVEVAVRDTKRQVRALLT